MDCYSAEEYVRRELEELKVLLSDLGVLVDSILRGLWYSYSPDVDRARLDVDRLIDGLQRLRYMDVDRLRNWSFYCLGQQGRR